MPLESGNRKTARSRSEIRNYNSTDDTRAVAKGEVVAIPLPRPAVRNDARPSLDPSPTPRGLVRADHDQFITWSADSALDRDVSALVFLQDRMIAAGWRLWLPESVERFQDVQARLRP